MKWLLILLICLLPCSPVAALDFSRHQVRPFVRKVKLVRPINQVLARITVYWAKGLGTDRNTRRHNASWAGYGKLHEGHCAVDPRKIPYGSKVKLPDADLVAVDTGSAVVSRKAARLSGHTVVERAAIVVDRFFETRRSALAWANTHPLFCMITVQAL